MEVRCLCACVCRRPMCLACDWPIVVYAVYIITHRDLQCTHPKTHSVVAPRIPHWCFPMVVSGLSSLSGFRELYSASKNFSKTFCSVLKLQNHSIHSPSGDCHTPERVFPPNYLFWLLHFCSPKHRCVKGNA